MTPTTDQRAVPGTSAGDDPVKTGMELPVVQIVEILPTKVWIESDMLGSRFVVAQHQGQLAFTYAAFHYDYAYTDNATTHRLAEQLAKSLGARDPIEHRQRPGYDMLGAQMAPPSRSSSAHRSDGAGDDSTGAQAE